MALGIAFLNFVQAILNAFIQFWTMKRDNDPEFPDFFDGAFGALAFEIADRPVYLAGIVESAFALLAVVGVVILVIRTLRTIELPDD